MRQVFLAPDRTFEIAPLTIEQRTQLRQDVVESHSLDPSEREQIMPLLKLRTCHDAVTNAGSRQNPRELADSMTSADLDSFFRQVLRITRCAKLPAFARRRSHLQRGK